jgi:hypothetical protein
MKITRKELIEKWLEALESGEYKQGKGALRIENGQTKYCCLGVLCDVANQYSSKDYFKDSDNSINSILPLNLAKFVNIAENGEFYEGVRRNGKWYSSLTQMNDRGVRFKTIARIIREQMEKGNFEKP